MPSGNAGRRYALAIFNLAREQGKLEQWAEDLNNLDYTLKQPEVQSFLDNPKTSREDKIQLVQKTLANRVSPGALNLALILVRRDRQTAMSQITEEYTKYWNKLRGIEVARVTTAVPLDPETQEAVRTRLATLTGKQITVQMQVDPEILGGLVAQVGDTLLDGSVRTRLQNLRKQLA